MPVPPFQSVLRIFFVALCVSLVVMGIFSKRGLLDWRRMARQNTEIAEKIASLQIEKEKWQRQSDTLEKDTAEQERVVRQVVGYVLPTEVVIEFE